MKKSIFVILFFLLYLSTAHSQEQLTTSTSLHVLLNKESKNRDIIMNVSNENREIHLNVSGTITKGRLGLEIQDPKGKVYRSININSEDITDESIESITRETRIFSLNNESINGVVRLTLDTPMLGDWIIKINPNNSVGRIYIGIIQNINAEKIEKINL